MSISLKSTHEQWFVMSNPLKSDTVTFSRKQYQPYYPPVEMNQQQIKEVNSHKHIDFVLTKDCTWPDHLVYIKSIQWETLSSRGEKNADYHYFIR